MDHKLTELIGKWLATPENERDYTVGALYLLKFTRNQIMYKNIIAQIDRRHDFIEYQLQKYWVSGQGRLVSTPTMPPLSRKASTADT